MMNKLKLILLSLFIGHSIFGQDPFFSQYFKNKLFLNPAFVGEDKKSKAFLNYRNQWPDIGASFVSYAASYDQYLKFLYGGIGAYVMNDRQGGGIYNNIQASAMYSFHLRTSKYSYLYTGLQGGYGMSSINSQDLIFGDMFNPATSDFSNSSNYAQKSESVMTPDFSAGIVYKIFNTKKTLHYTFGIATHHLTKPLTLNYTKINRKYTAHASALFPFTFNRLGRLAFELEPIFMYQMQGEYNFMLYGANFIQKFYSLGFYARHNNMLHLPSFIFTASVIQPEWSIGYSFDYTPQKVELYLSTFGGHEVTFLLNLQYKKHLRKF